MGGLEFFNVYLFGEEFKIQNWSIQNWLIAIYNVGVLLATIAGTYSLQLTLIMFERVKYSKVLMKCEKRVKACLYFIPILGGWLLGLWDQIDNFLDEIILKYLHKMNQILPLMVHIIIVRKFFVNNKNIKIFYTHSSDDVLLYSDDKLLTTLLISNHRSLNDYFLIIYMILYKNGAIKETDGLTDTFIKLWDCEEIRDKIRFEFLSWGSIYNLPTWKLFKNITLKDENVAISSDTLKESIQTKGEQVFILFPEVNILTTELSIIQRKLNQDYYPFVNKYYNVLSPRFQQFINTLTGFKDVVNSTLNQKGPSGKFFMKRKKSVQANEEVTSQDKLILFNKFLYDITIVYYTPKLVSNGHNHDSGNLKVINGIQIEEINPSFFKLFQSKNNSEISPEPTIIVIDVQKHPVSPLLLMNAKKLEKWVELQWVRKESLINNLHSEVSLQ